MTPKVNTSKLMRVLNHFADRFKKITQAMREARDCGDLVEVSRLTDQGIVDGQRLARLYELDLEPHERKHW
jgi:hypothetical protein